MPLSQLEALKLWFQRTPVGPIRRALAAAERADLPITVDQLETCSLSGGDVEHLVEAMIDARRLGQTYVFRIALAQELARVMGIQLPEGRK